VWPATGEKGWKGDCTWGSLRGIFFALLFASSLVKDGMIVSSCVEGLLFTSGFVTFSSDSSVLIVLSPTIGCIHQAKGFASLRSDYLVPSPKCLHKKKKKKKKLHSIQPHNLNSAGRDIRRGGGTNCVCY